MTWIRSNYVSFVVYMFHSHVETWLQLKSGFKSIIYSKRSFKLGFTWLYFDELQWNFAQSMFLLSCRNWNQTDLWQFATRHGCKSVISFEPTESNQCFWIIQKNRFWGKNFVFLTSSIMTSFSHTRTHQQPFWKVLNNKVLLLDINYLIKISKLSKKIIVEGIQKKVKQKLVFIMLLNNWWFHLGFQWLNW